MPYVDVWVDDPGPTEKQISALRLLVKLSREAADAIGREALAGALDDAATLVSKEFDLKQYGHPTTDPVFPVDKKYLDWQDSRKKHGLDQGTRT